MKYINKQLASLVADNMLKSAKEKIETKQTDLNLFCEKIVINSIPKDVYELILKLPDEWIEKAKGFYLTSPYSENHGMYINTVHDTPKKQYSTGKIQPTKLEYEHIKSASDEIKAMKEKLNQLHDQIVATLLKLRTLEKIQKEFPNAYKNLPKDSMGSKNEIAIPVEKILLGINNFPA